MTRKKLNETVEKPAAEWVPTGQLKPWKKNPRNNAAAIKEVKRSIRRFGFGSPIVAHRATGTIIAGHTRWEAARQLRMQRVPVRFMDITEDEARALTVADNKLGEIAEWNEDMLAEILAEMQEAGTDLEIGTGFTEKHLAAILRQEDDVDLEATRTPEIESKFQIVVTCKNEQAQVELLERLQGEGFRVRALVS